MLDLWRRGWDSNPRYSRGVNRISSPIAPAVTSQLQNDGVGIGRQVLTNSAIRAGQLWDKSSSMIGIL